MQLHKKYGWGKTFERIFTKKKKKSKNFTLLMIVSIKKIEAWIIVEGGVD